MIEEVLEFKEHEDRIGNLTLLGEVELGCTWTALWYSEECKQ